MPVERHVTDLEHGELPHRRYSAPDDRNQQRPRRAPAHSRHPSLLFVYRVLFIDPNDFDSSDQPSGMSSQRMSSPPSPAKWQYSTMATALPGENPRADFATITPREQALRLVTRSRRVPLSPGQQGSRHSLWQPEHGPFRPDRAGQDDRSSPRKGPKESEPKRLQ